MLRIRNIPLQRHPTPWMKCCIQHIRKFLGVCHFRSLSCQEFVMSGVCLVRSLSRQEFISSGVCLVRSLSCQEFVMSGVCHVRSLPCQEFVSSGVCHVRSLSRQEFVMAPSYMIHLKNARREGSTLVLPSSQ